MLSLFTPSHDSKFLPDAYESLRAQTDPDWHWTVVHNNGGIPFECEDPRVEQHILYRAPEWVGPLKAYACEKAKGDLLMEFDHDDMLMPTAVEKCKKAFEDPAVGFVYSNAVHCDGNFKPALRYDAAFGWQHRDFYFRGETLHEPRTPAPTPTSLSRIWYAPNHFRAFRRSTYEAVGGYAKDMRVLDDQDLMCKMYLQAEFRHIDEPLYLYRIHGGNSWLKHNEEIQANVLRLHDVYAERLACKWADRLGMRKIELGGAIAAAPGFETVDRHNASICCDLNGDWPIPDNSVGVIRAMDIFEHLVDPVHTMRECYRVLIPGGWIFAQVPSTDGRGAFQDPTHKSFWNENSWLYYTHANWARYIDTPVRFQAVRAFTTEKDKMGVCWTKAHLVSLKDGYRPPGLVTV